MLTVNIFLYFQHAVEKVNMRLNRNVQSQNRFTIGLVSDMRFANHIQEFDYLADLWYSYFQN